MLVKPSLPLFCAQMSADQAGVVAATPTKIQFATEVIDRGGDYYDPALYRYTPPQGWVQFMVRAFVAGVTAAAGATIFLYKNGAAYAASTVVASGIGLATPILSEIVTTNGTDYWEAWAMGPSAGTLTFTRLNNGVPGTSFMGAML